MTVMVKIFRGRFEDSRGLLPLDAEYVNLHPSGFRGYRLLDTTVIWFNSDARKVRNRGVYHSCFVGLHYFGGGRSSPAFTALVSHFLLTPAACDT